jgi:hypothetical protein
VGYTEQQKKSIYKYRKENPESTKNRITVTLPAKDKALLQAVSDRTGESKSELVRRLVNEEAERTGIKAF